jgi:hypothetical protein
MEMNNLISEQSPIQQSDTQYIITSSPYISLICNNNGYNVINNSYKIKVDKNLPANKMILANKEHLFVGTDSEGDFNNVTFFDKSTISAGDKIAVTVNFTLGTQVYKSQVVYYS